MDFGINGKISMILFSYETYLDPNFDWDTLYTAQILDLLRMTYNTAYEDPEDIATKEKLRDIFKAVLASREHLPNKTERKVMRQERAKAQQNR
jgi:hypothetical protein